MAESADGQALLLGQVTPVPLSPDQAILQAVPAPLDNMAEDFRARGRVYNHATYAVRLSCPEFTSLCPITGQPDFAHVVIDYVPYELLVESKSLKLFLASFRNHPDFHETCSAYIGRRIAEVTAPIWMRVSAFWFPRGGIPIDITWELGDFPKRLRIPTLDIPTYRAR